ncbi:hypothetical protein SISSUDRAFT_1042562 [Sistotremastrum suecicum HHB10207 ss-3]|uniref:Nicotinamide N-methyltransferase n=1 Tax=Sistotremastrum suecicum HHB10207 ss-3 TaxID=1314776 RepID=A0A166GJN5_9AGAM|nr:hypothetical protein SISSUDRAFT_1042562 [Sistotremastrum suecicum HHB10207 ss-3]
MEDQAVQQEPEDVLSDSLYTLYDYVPVARSSAGATFTYTTPDDQATLTLATPDPHHSNWNLHASSIWVAALWIADHIAELLGDFDVSCHKNVIELGSGAGLPGILVAHKFRNWSITLTDYPDPNILKSLEESIQTNQVSANARVVGYDWNLPRHGDFDLILAADTIWNSSLHDAFISAIRNNLNHDSDRSSCAFIVAGFHTGRWTVAKFLERLSASPGFSVDVVEREAQGTGRRPWCVERDNEDEESRRKWVVLITVKWAIA